MNCFSAGDRGGREEWFEDIKAQVMWIVRRQGGFERTGRLNRRLELRRAGEVASLESILGGFWFTFEHEIMGMNTLGSGIMSESSPYISLDTGILD